MAQNRRRDLESALASAKSAGGGSSQQNRDGQSLFAAVETAGQRVSELRHRVQLDEKIEKLDLTKNDLEQQAIELMDRQILPPWMLAGDRRRVCIGCGADSRRTAVAALLHR